MRPRLARLLLPTAVALALLVAVLSPATSGASPGQASYFQDDDLLIFNSPEGTAQTLDLLRSLGVERIRVSMFWGTVAPDPLSRRRPAFDASDPNAYPVGAWDRYDRIVELAAARGIGVDFDITSPAPEWATQPSPRADIANLWEPSDAEFAAFVHAAGTRYSGSFSPPPPPATPPSPAPAPPAPPACNPLVALIQPCPADSALLAHTAQAPASPIPRVSFWSLWNEPNQPGWLDPQWTAAPRGGGYVEASPRLYRGLLDSAWSALSATGHGGDTILLGETAPKGLSVKGPTRAIKALHFIRALYCLDDRYRRLRGAAASARGCPAGGPASAFAAAHPALFHASGWAHHPYELTFAPDRRPTDPDYATTANLPALSSVLHRAQGAYRAGGGLPLYLTEFGYNTAPPNPAGVSLARQALYLNQAEFMAYENPAVRSFDQFLLDDDAPRPGRNGVTQGYGATFQTGLRFHDGSPKPSLAAYRLPLFLPNSRIRRFASLRVWGMVRPARGAPARVAVQFLAAGSHGSYRTLASATANRGNSYLDTRVRVPGSGTVRLSWTPPGGPTLVSRAASVTVVR